MLERVKPIIQLSKPESYNCEKCHDTQFIDVVDEEGNIRKDRCSCYYEEQARIMMERSGLAGAVDRLTFDSFIAKTPLQKQIKQKAMDYLNALLEAREDRTKKIPWFYIGGNPGSGKTHICTAICGELLKRGIAVKYMEWLNDSVKLKFSLNDENFDEILSEYVNVPVLYIDDLLKQKYTDDPVFSEADVKTAFRILDGRYSRKKPTIISTEWDLVDHLVSADEGSFSRTYEQCKGFMVSISRDVANNYRMTGGSADG